MFFLAKKNNDFYKLDEDEQLTLVRDAFSLKDFKFI